MVKGTIISLGISRYPAWRRVPARTIPWTYLANTTRLTDSELGVKNTGSFAQSRSSAIQWIMLTALLRVADNALVVKGRIVRDITAGLSVLGVLALAFLPPQHVHFTRTHDDHHSDVIHRHFESHHPVGSQTTVGDEDDEVQWLDELSFTSPTSAVRIYPANQFVYEDLPVSPSRPVFQWMLFRAVRDSVHDPPWATPHGLRAPPCLSA